MIAGQGLHTGRDATVKLSKREGRVVVRCQGREADLAAMRVVGTERSTVIASADGSVRVGTVEHLFSAFGGAGVFEGVVIEIEGGEAPLADGGARAYVDELRALGVPSSEPRLRVVRDDVISVGDSSYAFATGEGIAMEVEIDFGDPRLDKHARWEGDAEDFRRRIASARTFGFEHEVSALLEKGLASHVSPESVVVIGKDRVLSSGAPFTADEPARHKLLDMIGDMYVHGGPPRGSVRATRPGHAATHEAVRLALDAGVLVRAVP